MSRSDLVALDPPHTVSRRAMLRLIGAGVAALGSGCLSRAGDETIATYANDPPERHPGRIVRYATALVLDGFATGVVAELHDGRPTKLDGNPAHPASAGGSLPWLQARILDLVDPQRSRTARIGGSPAGVAEILRSVRTLPPGPLWLVMPPQSSPAIAALLASLRARREVHVVHDAPLARRAAYDGIRTVYDQPLEQQIDFARVDVALALDADPLAGMPMSAAWARAAASRRAPEARPSRWWVAEPLPTPTGTIADERLACAAGDVALVAIVIAAELAAQELAAQGLAAQGLAAMPALPPELVRLARARLGAPGVAWAVAVAADLAAHRGAGAVVVGDRQPACVHALARWIDEACGNVGRGGDIGRGGDARGGPVTLTPPAILEPLGGESLATLAAAARAGAAVVVIDCDPVYTAPHALGLADALAAAHASLHVGAYANATAAACAMHAPLAHELEQWADARAYDGTLSVLQPLAAPRAETLSPIELLAALAGDPRDARAIVRAPFPDETAWIAALRAGFVAGTRATPVTAAPRWPAALTDELARAIAPAAASIEIALAASIEIALAASPQLHDGRFAANAWLQELPHPITKQTWGNAALLSPATAAALGVADEDRVELRTAAGAVVLPALIVPGAADGAITVELGHGQRTPAAPIADRVGTDAYALRTGDARILRGELRRVGGTTRVVRTQTTFTTEGREVAPVTTLAALRPDTFAHLRGDQPSLLPARAQTGWGMSIDTSICTGCSACMVACQAENNIPSVGADEVARGRHMNWLRIDRYVAPDGAAVAEPMPCQHCEDAPCEYVCPVGATTHSPDGLNEQIYNRCVGTRFCSNNCPYKVRRFNWFQPDPPGTRALQFNPDVTVRERGVMEKCTYCVQRIRRAEQQAIVDGRSIRVGEVRTACQAACPTGAIQFGQITETDTPFARTRTDVRRFEVLHDLGTRPRTLYLAKVTNPKGAT
ncbi:MAG TPA: 4Fe-4S dicluster domain-containing protein [Kofleriaceae bacterium]